MLEPRSLGSVIKPTLRTTQNYQTKFENSCLEQERCEEALKPKNLLNATFEEHLKRTIAGDAVAHQSEASFVAGIKARLPNPYKKARTSSVRFIAFQNTLRENYYSHDYYRHLQN